MLWKILNLNYHFDIILCFDSIIHHRDFPCQLFVFWAAVCWLLVVVVVATPATPKQWENIIRYCHIVNVSSFHSTAENFFNQSNLFFVCQKPNRLVRSLTVFPHCFWSLRFGNLHLHPLQFGSKSPARSEWQVKAIFRRGRCRRA